MKILKTINKNFYQDLEDILNQRVQQNIDIIDGKVKDIIHNVKLRGDEALFEYSKKFDDSNISEKNISLSEKIRLSYLKEVDKDVMNAFRIAIKNVKKFHEKQLPKSYEVIDRGVKTHSLWKPIQSVGLYIPGGNAVYPSSVIMNAVPALVAGVERIAVVTPAKSDNINPYILALLDELKISEIYQIGGAHSIAALAYGTKSIKPVNKIFGPGNDYVASAKKQVFGKVGIDLFAGPSEIVVVADKHNNPNWVAADLIAQSEHDERSQSILITDNEDFANKVLTSVKKLSSDLSRKDIIKKSLKNYGIIIIADDLNYINTIIDFIAPEHLHLQNKDCYNLLPKINNAGGIFVGEYCSEAFGDYIVGTNHILPTSGSAKYSSGVGVLDFMKRSSLVEMNYDGYKINQENVSKMAIVEGLEGHKLSVKIRQIAKK